MRIWSPDWLAVFPRLLFPYVVVVDAFLICQRLQVYSEIFTFFQVLLRESYEDIRASCVGLARALVEINAGLQGTHPKIFVCHIHK